MVEPPFKLRVPAKLVGLIRGSHPELKRKLRASLRAILHDPGVGKTLRDQLEGLRSYRVGHFRIIYQVSKRGRIVELVAIGPRARIYADTLRLIKRDHSG